MRGTRSVVEEWRDIPGFEGRYQVSDAGRVRSRSRVLAPFRHRDGYLQVKLCSRGEESTRFVHRLVCQAFNGDAKGREVNHKDGDKTNNIRTNLHWTDRSGNMKHAATTGLLNLPDNSGERNGMSVLTETEVRRIKELRGTATQKELAILFGVSRRAVGMILSGERWGHVNTY